MANPAMLVRVAATLDVFKANLADGVVAIDTTRAALVRMAAGYDGSKIIQQAGATVAAITEIGGVTQLTAEEQAKANAVLDAAILKYQALGKTVPPAMQEMADATKQNEKNTADWSSALESAKTVIGALGIGLSVGALVEFSKQLVTNATSLQFTASMLGETTSAVEKQKFAIEQSGGSWESLSAAITFMNRNVTDETPKAVKAIVGLGLSIDQLKAIGPEQSFDAITAAIQKLPDPMQQSAAAMDIFGRGAKDILPAIKAGFVDVGSQAPLMEDSTVTALANMDKSWKSFKSEIEVFAADTLNRLQQGWQFWKEQGLDPATKALIEAHDKAVIFMKDAENQKAVLDTVSAAFGVNTIAQNNNLMSEAGLLQSQQKHIDALGKLENGLTMTRIAVDGMTDATKERIVSDLAAGASAQKLADVMGVSVGVIDLVVADHKKYLQAVKDNEAEAKRMQDEEARLQASIDKSSDRIVNLLNVGLGPMLAKMKETTMSIPAEIVATDALAASHLDLSDGVTAAVIAMTAGGLSADAIFKKLKDGKQVTDAEKDSVVVLSNEIKNWAKETDNANDSLSKILKSLPAAKLYMDPLAMAAKAVADAHVPLAANVRTAAIEMLNAGLTVDQVTAKLVANGDITKDDKDKVQALSDTHQKLDQSMQLVIKSLGQLAALGGALGGLAAAGAEIAQGFQLAETHTGGLLNGLRDITDGKTEKGFSEIAASVAGATADILSFGQGLETANKETIVLTDAMKGAKIGTEIMPGWGTLIGAGIGALIGAFTTPETQKIAEDAGNTLGMKLSDGMTLAIAKTEQTLKQADSSMSDSYARQVAIVLSLSTIIDQSGGVLAKNTNDNEANVDRFASAAMNLFNIIKFDGTNSAAAMKQLDTVVGDLVDSTVKAGVSFSPALSTLLTSTLNLSGGVALVDSKWSQWVKDGTDGAGVLSRGLVGLEQQMDSLGQTSATIAKYRADQMTAAETGIASAVKVTSDAYAAQQADITTLGTLQDQLANATSGDQASKIQASIDKTNADLVTQQAILAATSVSSQGEATAVADAEIAAVDAKVKAGSTWIAAILSQKTEIQGLATELQNTGFAGGAAFDLITSEVKLASDKVAGPALQAMEGYTQAVVGLNNSGNLTSDMYTGLESRIGATEKTIEAEGYSHAQVMAAMQGDLQTAWELQQQYGYKVDDSTQALIDEAVQTGVVGETHKSTSEQMLDLQKQMTAAVVRLANAIAGPPTSAAGAMDNFAATAKAALDDTSKNAGTTAGDITSSFKGLKFTIPVKYDIPDVPTAPGTKGAASGALVGPYSLEYLAGGGNVLSFIPRASDTVPAMLTPGEGVVNTTGMSLLGVDGLRSLNRGAAPAAGGSTGSVDLSGVHGELKALRSDMRRTQQDLPRAIGIALTDALALLPKRVA